MFSTDSFKYLKSLASAYRENLPRPAAFEDEFIIYAQSLVQGLNFNTHQKYSLEYALPDLQDHIGMEAMIVRGGWPDSGLNLRVRTTRDGRFYLEIHTSSEQLPYHSPENKSLFRKLVKPLLDKPGLNRYFTLHSEGSLAEQNHFIRYEMPLRQLRSRNLLEYSLFILGQAAPFMEAALKAARESRKAAAA